MSKIIDHHDELKKSLELYGRNELIRYLIAGDDYVKDKHFEVDGFKDVDILREIQLWDCGYDYMQWVSIKDDRYQFCSAYLYQIVGTMSDGEVIKIILPKELYKLFGYEMVEISSRDFITNFRQSQQIPF